MLKLKIKKYLFLFWAFGLFGLFGLLVFDLRWH